MIIVWSSNVSGPYALMLPVVFYGISYFVDEISVLLQGLRAGLFGAAITLAVLGLLALACKVSFPRVWDRVYEQCRSTLSGWAAAARAPPPNRNSARMSTGGRAPAYAEATGRQQGTTPVGTAGNRRHASTRMQTGGRAPPRRTHSERFSEVARAVQQLPAQLYVSEQDLQAKNAHELKELMKQHGLPWREGEVMDKSDAIQRILESSDSSSQSCPVCCEDYKQGDVLRQLRCKHRFHLECIDRWCLASADRSTTPACPMCNTPIC